MLAKKLKQNKREKDKKTVETPVAFSRCAGIEISTHVNTTSVLKEAWKTSGNKTFVLRNKDRKGLSGKKSDRLSYG